MPKRSTGQRLTMIAVLVWLFAILCLALVMGALQIAGAIQVGVAWWLLLAASPFVVVCVGAIVFNIFKKGA